VGQVAALREQEPSLRLVQTLAVPGQAIGGISAVKLGPVQYLMLEAVKLTGPQGTTEDGTAGRAGIDASRDVEQLLP
jgi:hypothetical protein